MMKKNVILILESKLIFWNIYIIRFVNVEIDPRLR